MNSQQARRAAECELQALGERLGHVASVADLAGSVPVELERAERDVLVASAWLHDIGYGERLAVTDFHALDGARWLAARGEHRLASLVANHTGAVHEARNRGLLDELAEFEPEASLVADVLTWCDLRTGPAGERVEPSERLAEIRQRYGDEHLVPRSLRAAEPELMVICSRVEKALG